MYREEPISAQHLPALLGQNMTDSECQSASGTAIKNTVNEKAARQEDAPECQNGVCLVTWKPQRPAA